MENKENKKIIIAIIAIAITIVTIGTGTFAYWQWATSTAQNTLVNVTVQDGISMTITPTTTQTNVLYPVTRNNCGLASISGSALVTIVNNTGVLARPQFYLKLQIFDKNGNNITATQTSYTGDGTKTYAEYINFAVADATSQSSATCANALRSGAFTTTQTSIPNTMGGGGSTPVSGWYNSPMITVLGTSNHPKLPATDGTSMSYDAAPMATTSHTFNYWAWIDSSYTFQNIGTVVSDPLQDAKIYVSWSETSEVIQVR